MLKYMILLWTAPGSLWGLEFTRREQKQFPKNNMVVDVITHGESTCKEELKISKAAVIPAVMVLLRRMSQYFGFKLCAHISDGNVLSVKGHI